MSASGIVRSRTGPCGDETEELASQLMPVPVELVPLLEGGA
jgi:hypothetical protein